VNPIGAVLPLLAEVPPWRFSGCLALFAALLPRFGVHSHAALLCCVLFDPEHNPQPENLSLKKPSKGLPTAPGPFLFAPN